MDHYTSKLAINQSDQQHKKKIKDWPKEDLASPYEAASGDYLFYLHKITEYTGNNSKSKETWVGDGWIFNGWCHLTCGFLVSEETFITTKPFTELCRHWIQLDSSEIRSADANKKATFSLSYTNYTHDQPLDIHAGAFKQPLFCRRQFSTCRLPRHPLMGLNIYLFGSSVSLKHSVFNFELQTSIKSKWLCYTWGVTLAFKWWC